MRNTTSAKKMGQVSALLHEITTLHPAEKSEILALLAGASRREQNIRHRANRQGFHIRERTNGKIEVRAAADGAMVIACWSWRSLCEVLKYDRFMELEEQAA